MKNDLEIIKELKKRSIKFFDAKKHCFKEQISFLNDKSPFVTACCSRRSGKTEVCAADLVATSSSGRDQPTLYLTLSRKNAKKIIWPKLLEINSLYNLGGKPNETDLTLSFKGASTIYVSGAKDKSEIENFRGMPFKKIYIDESQSFRSYLQELIDDVLSPTLYDYAGLLRLIGTPGPVPTGYFFDACHSSEWNHHIWTMHNNPWLEKKSGMKVPDLIERDLKRRGVSIDHPSIQRECFGRWVLDSESLVYLYDKSRNDFSHLPQGKYEYIMGIDFGYEDADAICILAWNEESPVTYLVDEMVTPKQGITPLVAQIEAFRKTYDISKIVADFGGLGKKISEEITRRYQIPLLPADKARKHESIELMNDALRTSRFKAKSTSRFAQDAMLLEWDVDKSTPDKKVVSDSFHSDILDAALYAFRESPSFAWTEPTVKPKYGSKEWAKKEADDMQEAAEQHFREIEENRSDWEYS